MANNSHFSRPVIYSYPRVTESYLPTLDGWRALAITLVLLAHGSDSIKYFIMPMGLDFNIGGHWGLFGVQIFFGLSGFLITTKIISDEKTRGCLSLRSFYIRRVFRILPASITALAVIGLMSIFGIIEVGLNRWLATIFFYANYSTAESSWYVGHFWSLAVEEHFYFVWPLIFVILKNNQRRIAFTITAAIALAVWRAIDFKFQISASSSPAHFWGRTDIQADSILWGVIVALIYSDEYFKRHIDNIITNRFVVFWVFVVVLATHLFQAEDWKVKFVLITIKAIAVPLAMLSTQINMNTFGARLLESALFRRVGRLSFSLYLYQQIFLVWNRDDIQKIELIQWFPLNIALAILVASISLKFVERPMIEVGHKLAARRAPY